MSRNTPTCRECRAPIAGAALYRGRSPGWEIYCAGCYVQVERRKQRQAWESWRDYWESRFGRKVEPFEERPVWVPETKPCEVCGREAGFALPRRCRYWVCSHDCDRERQNRRRRVRHEPRPCASCGASFTPSRRDARYCCNGCRQSAFRQRKGGA